MEEGKRRGERERRREREGERERDGERRVVFIRTSGFVRRASGFVCVCLKKKRAEECKRVCLCALCVFAHVCVRESCACVCVCLYKPTGVC